MITIKYDPNKDPQLLLIEHANDIRDHGVQAISESFELNLDEALVAEFEVKEEEETKYIDFCIPKENWLDFLETALTIFEQDEIFDKCIEVSALITKLKA